MEKNEIRRGARRGYRRWYYHVSVKAPMADLVENHFSAQLVLDALDSNTFCRVSFVFWCFSTLKDLNLYITLYLALLKLEDLDDTSFI